MLYTILSLVAFLTAFVVSSTSPFLLHSTAQLTFESTYNRLPVAEVHSLFSSFVSSCPTKKYAVFVQPGIDSADYTHRTTLFRKYGPSSFTVRDVDGRVNVVAVINTILMDCLHHGIERVEELSTDTIGVEGTVLPTLDRDTIEKSIVYATLPGLEDIRGLESRSKALDLRDAYIEGVVKEYFGGEDYTLVYITEARQPGQQEQTSVDSAEGDPAQILLTPEQR